MWQGIMLMKIVVAGDNIGLLGVHLALKYDMLGAELLL